MAVFVGNATGETLAGGGEHDTIYGAGGDDLLSGDSGDDSLFGGAGSDTASYTAATAGVLVTDMVSASGDASVGVDVLGSRP